jgi:hypothetical protein
MKKTLVTLLIVLTGIFSLYTSIVCACPGHNNNLLNFLPVDTADLDTWTMKIKILGNTEPIMNIGFIDYAKIKDDLERNKKGIRKLFCISTKTDEADEIRTFVILYNDASKALDCYTLYSEWRRIRRCNNKQFENDAYEDTTLTLKELMDSALKLTDRDQITIKDKTVLVLERAIAIRGFINTP